jgi:hypothetical protein
MISKQTLDKLASALASLGLCPGYYSAPNILSRLALGGWQMIEFPNSVGFLGKDGAIRLAPLSDFKGLYTDMLSALEKHPLACVPEVIAEHMKKVGMPVTASHSDFLFSTAKARDLPGGSLARLRAYRNAVAKDHTVEVTDAPPIAELLDINRSWYRQAALRKFRTFEKTNIDWLLNNWTDALALAPDIRATVVRKDGKAVAFLVSALVGGVPTIFTRRFATTAENGVNAFALSGLAASVSGDFINDGPASDSGVKKVKQRLAVSQVKFYAVDQK